jgi:hypothetical protein
MTGPVARWLRRPMFWKSGLSVADLLFLIVFCSAGVLVILLVVIGTSWRSP